MEVYKKMQTYQNDPRIFNSSRSNTDTTGSVVTFSLESDPIRVPAQATNIIVGVVSSTFWYNFPNIIGKSWIVRLYAEEALGRVEEPMGRLESGPYRDLTIPIPTGLYSLSQLAGTLSRGHTNADISQTGLC